MTTAMRDFYRTHCKGHIESYHRNLIAVADDALYLATDGKEVGKIDYPAGTTMEDLDDLAHYAYFAHKRAWAWLWH